MKKLIAAAVIMASSSAIAAGHGVSHDILDMAAAEKKNQALGLVTRTAVDALARKGKQLFNGGDCQQAMPVLKEYAVKADWLATMIDTTLTPYHNASASEQKSIMQKRKGELMPVHDLAQSYREKSAVAVAMYGDCLMQLENPKAAVPVLMKALELLPASNETWWNRTGESLLKAIRVDPEKK
ncbi:hypothetical protein [Oceanospirillum sediminis]|uniref:Tetratricopeptide repeat protein n=1 Tax=Oceanospirillum sediminis TaxID=2760088 RepID=A0A839IN17_9GAMM|nr:hypothetical protein [Oceanospirillum sediminis]MBB1485902.1 hypothetical protein [Oceanospirillum sediminis]